METIVSILIEVGIVVGTILVMWGIYNLFNLKSNVYWNEKEGQIKTRSGKCLYDKNVTDSKNANLTNLEIFVEKLNKQAKILVTTNNDIACDLKGVKAQLQCAAKGHGDWKFVGDLKRKWERTDTEIPLQGATSMTVMSYTASGNDGFIFKCSNCGLEITKTKKELTASEKEALKKLKLL
jgi:hypothetical protein